MTTPSRRARERAMAFHSDFRGGSLELLLIYILCERHEGSLSEKAHRVPQLNRFM